MLPWKPSRAEAMQEAHKAIMKTKKFIDYAWFSGYRAPNNLIETQFDKND